MKTIILLLLTIFLTACASPQQTQVSTTQVAVADNSSVQDRKNILNVLHTEVQKRLHVDAVFTVHYLKIHRNWAYIETTGGGDPGINAVLVKVNGKWKLAKSTHPCTPVCPNGMASCADGELICKYTLHQQFPNAPIAIFPSPQARRMVFNP